MKIKYQAKVDNSGHLIIHDRKSFYKEVNLLAGKDVFVTVEKMQRNRTNQQNRYYFGVLVPLVRQGLIDVGYNVSIEETHDLIKAKFAKRELVNETTGEILKTVGSTAKMNTIEFANLVDSVVMWAAEFLGVVIPLPDEQVEMQFEN
jgi:hypothetical protein